MSLLLYFSVLILLTTIATAIKKKAKTKFARSNREKQSDCAPKNLLYFVDTNINSPTVVTINPNEFQPLKMYFRFMTAIRNFRELK